MLKNYSLIKILLLSLVGISLARAQVHKVDLHNELSSNFIVDLYETAGTQKVKKLPVFSQLKDLELQGKWSECAKLAPRVFQQQSLVRGWVGLVWLKCLEQEQNKKAPKNNLISRQTDKALRTLEKERGLIAVGPWSQDLQALWIKLRLVHFEEQAAKKNKIDETSLERILDGSFVLSSEQKAKIYLLLGDQAMGRRQKGEAQFFYEAAQNQKNSKVIEEKLAPFQHRKKLTGTDKSYYDFATADSGREKSELEKVDERLKQALKKNEPLPLLSEVMFVLNQYPNSNLAKQFKEKPLAIYNSLSDKQSKEKALIEIADTDADRALDWAQSLHRRGDYSGSLLLAQKIMEDNPSFSQMQSVLWIAGRSSHFLGSYDRALEFFKNLAQFHEGTEEASEALLRTGLIYYRKKDFTKASESFSKLLAQKRDRYDLSAKYWLIRSLEATNSKVAKDEIVGLIEKYPFSYYGLRLRAETQDGKLNWPPGTGDVPKVEKEFYLVGKQKESWQRFKILSEAGWIQEAQIEIADRPFMKEPSLKWSLAQKLAESHQYSMAIRLVNEVLEADSRLRREAFIKIGYPLIYEKAFDTESRHYGVPVVVLRSLARQESAFNPKAVSSSNALGLMQLIPPTAQEVSKKLSLKIELPEDLFRPSVNIAMGSFYVAQMLDQFQGNLPFALAAYNAGPHRLKTWLEGRAEVLDLVTQQKFSVENEMWFDELPWNETSLYVKSILRNILIYRLVNEGSFDLKPAFWADNLNKKDD